MLQIDERAYSVGLSLTISIRRANACDVLQLLVKKEQADWLDIPSTPGPLCQDEPAILSGFQPALDVEPVASSEDSSDIGSIGDDGQDTVFSDVSSSSSSVSCTSECCAPPSPAAGKLIKIPTHREKVLAYLGYATYFANAEEGTDYSLASKTMDSIFRFVISRIPRLLVRARAAGCASVQCFLASDELAEEDFARLWRALKYNNVHQEGKLTVQTVRNAISDAENEDKQGRKGPHIELLGGKVWKVPLDTELSAAGYDHFYRFVRHCALQRIS